MKQTMETWISWRNLWLRESQSGDMLHLKQMKISGPLLLGKVHPVLKISGIHVEVLLPAKLLRT